MLGFDPSRLLRADRSELPVLVEAVKRAHEFARERDRELAVALVNAQVESQRKGRRG